MAQPAIREEIRLAERLGIPPTVLWGDERAEGERMFTDLDIELFEAARLVDESISPRGIPVEDEVNPANQYRFIAGELVIDNDGNMVRKPLRNFAVSAQAKAEREFKAAFKDAENPDFDGLYWPVKLCD